MKQISNADFQAVLRLLDTLSLARGSTVRERENARKAALLARKRNDESRIHKNLQDNQGLGLV